MSISFRIVILTESYVLLNKFMIFYKVMCFTKQIYDLLTESHVLLSKFMILKIHIREIHGTYLGNIYGIYKECITNISIDIYDIIINIHKYIHQTHRRRLRRRPNGAAAFGGRPIGCLCV